jgi:hypothetical protein
METNQISQELRQCSPYPHGDVILTLMLDHGECLKKYFGENLVHTGTKIAARGNTVNELLRGSAFVSSGKSKINGGILSKSRPGLHYPIFHIMRHLSFDISWVLELVGLRYISQESFHISEL